jgi:hypothetical protein
MKALINARKIQKRVKNATDTNLSIGYWIATYQLRYELSSANACQ